MRSASLTRSISIRFAAFLTFVIASGFSSEVAAVSEPTGTEDAEIAHAIELRRSGRDAEALRELQQVHKRTGSTKSLAQVGLAEHALGRWVDAETHLDEALAASDPWIKRNARTLEQARAFVKAHIGDMEILGSPAGAEIFGEGRLLGRLPLSKPIRMPAGTAAIQMRAPGFLSAVRTINVVAGDLVRETIDLQPSVNEPAVANREPSVVVAPSPPKDEDGRGTTWHRPAAFIAGGTAVLAAGLAVVGWVVYERKNDEFSSRSCSSSGNAVFGPDSALCADIANSRRTAGITAIAGASAAGALALTSALLFVFDGGQVKPSDAGPAVSFRVQPGQAEARITLRF